MIKKFLSIFLAVVMVFSMSSSVFATETPSANQISSFEVDPTITAYAENVLPSHIHALGYGTDYYLGTPFTVTDVSTKTLTYFYPVIVNNSLALLLQVNKDASGELSSSLSESFAGALDGLLSSAEGNVYQLSTDGNHLMANSDSDFMLLYTIYEEADAVEMFSTSQDLPKGNLVLSRDDLFNMSDSGMAVEYRPDGPNSYKTLDVAGVSQGSKPWCWAATCAAMINFYKNEGLSASDVANYIFPDNPDQGGTWDNMKKAYNHWGLYPTQKSKISFSSIISTIDGNDPMHLGLVGHSVGLIGYEDWDSQDILIILEPNGGIHKSVTLKSNGNFNYYLSGNDAWRYTRMF